jgi:acetyl/propionyl-CoA carboxylase alpha subunit
VVTNIDFMQALLSHPDFQQGTVTTRWVETTFHWAPPSEPAFEALVAASLYEIAAPGTRSPVQGLSEVDPYSPWKTPGGFRN